MKKLLSSVFAILFSSSNTATETLIEFSTSMDFEEFEVVLNKLNHLDPVLTDELTIMVKNCQTSAVGEQRFSFKGFSGYVLLEKEDGYTFSIVIFTTKSEYDIIDKAYELATEELGI